MDVTNVPISSDMVFAVLGRNKHSYRCFCFMIDHDHGYAIIAVPTGIVTVEMSKLKGEEEVAQRICPHCMCEGHDANADYCKYCGTKL